MGYVREQCLGIFKRNTVYFWIRTSCFTLLGHALSQCVDAVVYYRASLGHLFVAYGVRTAVLTIRLIQGCWWWAAVSGSACDSVLGWPAKKEVERIEMETNGEEWNEHEMIEMKLDEIRANVKWMWKSQKMKKIKNQKSKNEKMVPFYCLTFSLL